MIPSAREIQSFLRRATSIARGLAGAGDVVSSEQAGPSRGPGAPELRMRYVGRAGIERELRFFEGAPELRSRAGGGILALLHELRRLERAPPEADLTAVDALSGLLAPREGWLSYHPFLRAVLEVEPTFEAQLARVRSRAERQRLNGALGRGFEPSLSRRLVDFERFYEAMYLPLVDARHRRDAHVVPRDAMRRLFLRRGALVVIRESGREVAAALVYRSRLEPGTLFYWRNGIAGAEGMDHARLGELNAALDAAVLQRAILERRRWIDFGVSKAFLDDGVFVHKGRLGCDFRVSDGAPSVLVRFDPARAGALARSWPLVVEGAAGFAGHLAIGGDDGQRSLRELGGNIKDRAFPSLRRLDLYPSPALAAEPALLPTVAALERELHLELRIAF